MEYNCRSGLSRCSRTAGCIAAPGCFSFDRHLRSKKCYNAVNELKSGPGGCKYHACMRICRHLATVLMDGAGQYLKECGMTDDEIRALRKYLCGE